LKAVLLVGGEGTRLRPLTITVPKSMVPIVNRPYLEHLILYLKEHDIDDIIMTLCYLPDPIRSYFGDGSSYGVKLTYIIENMPLGTAGAVRNVSNKIEETTFVLNGDIFTDINLSEMLQMHKAKSAAATIALTTVGDPTAYGVVETSTCDSVLRFVEKPRREDVTSNWINAGIYIIEPRILDSVPKDTRYMFERGVFPDMLERGDPIFGFKSKGYWIDIGTPEKYAALNRDLLMGRLNRAIPGKLKNDGIWLENNVKIGPGAVLEGPVAISSNCMLADAACVRGPSVIAPNCVIGKGSMIADSIIWGNAQIGDGARLQGCLLAEGVSIGKQAEISDGCILGHHVIIGEGEELAPGTVVWPESD